MPVRQVDNRLFCLFWPASVETGQAIAIGVIRPWQIRHALIASHRTLPWHG
jgi:hypothetical protein